MYHGVSFAFEAELTTTFHAIITTYDKWGDIWVGVIRYMWFTCFKRVHYWYPRDYYRSVTFTEKVMHLQIDLQESGFKSRLCMVGCCASFSIPFFLIETRKLSFIALISLFFLLLFLLFRGAPFYLTGNFFPKEDFSLGRFLMGHRPLDLNVILWL